MLKFYKSATKGRKSTWLFVVDPSTPSPTPVSFPQYPVEKSPEFWHMAVGSEFITAAIALFQSSSPTPSSKWVEAIGLPLHVELWKYPEFNSGYFHNSTYNIREGMELWKTAKMSFNHKLWFTTIVTIFCLTIFTSFIGSPISIGSLVPHYFQGRSYNLQTYTRRRLVGEQNSII